MTGLKSKLAGPALACGAVILALGSPGVSAAAPLTGGGTAPAAQPAAQRAVSGASTRVNAPGVGREYTLSATTAKNVKVTLSFAPGRAASATTSPTKQSTYLSSVPLSPGSRDVHLVTTRHTIGGEPLCLEARGALLLVKACDTRVAGQTFRFTGGEQRGTLRVRSGARSIVIIGTKVVRMSSDYPAEFVLSDKGRWNDPTAD